MTIQQASQFLSVSAANLRRLAIIRVIFLSTIGLALLYIFKETQVALSYPVHLSILLVFALLNVLTFWRVQQAWPVTDLEYFVQLLLDVLVLTALLYVSGGATNPFVSYYLVPLTICAALLPWRYTWIIAGLSLTAYTLMLFFYQPLIDANAQVHNPMSPAHNHNQTVSLHIIGMWFNFALSACLITYFVVIMAKALRQQEHTLAANREEVLRDEQILAVATLAAGTAHELGTPLSTMTVLIDEMEQDYQHSNALSEDLQLLQRQVSSCRNILHSLVSTAESHSHGQKSSVNIKHYLQQVITRWQVLRPSATIGLLSTDVEHQQILVDTTLEQAIINLLNNAADACQQNISMSIECKKQEVFIYIRDHGPGITLALAENIGKPFISTKGKGLGLGLFLSHATIKRFGGHIALYNHPEGGTVAQLTLPLSG
ncbi:HAMP domain-containing histidine kinase [bacterium AH-315-K03]|nr:HAMP domain-containing histidine kinase [bacterium AH-315-K03]